ncbi:hypothetical protein [Hugenholtzia roseola]|nr:hypothetical protein [Hugenholtzia roseola]
MNKRFSVLYFNLIYADKTVPTDKANKANKANKAVPCPYINAKQLIF